MVGNVYHVGTEWVSCYLVDTAEGLVLIDCTMQETLYQVIHNIFRLGFDPKNIKKLGAAKQAAEEKAEEAAPAAAEAAEEVVAEAAEKTE